MATVTILAYARIRASLTPCSSIGCYILSGTDQGESGQLANDFVYTYDMGFPYIGGANVVEGVVCYGSKTGIYSTVEGR